MRLDSKFQIERIVDVAKALSSPTRLAIIVVLRVAPMPLAAICARLNQDHYPASIYRHLEKLESAGLVKRFYDPAEKVLKYQLIVKKVEIGL